MKVERGMNCFQIEAIPCVRVISSCRPEMDAVMSMAVKNPGLKWKIENVEGEKGQTCRVESSFDSDPL